MRPPRPPMTFFCRFPGYRFMFSAVQSCNLKEVWLGHSLVYLFSSMHGLKKNLCGNPSAQPNGATRPLPQGTHGLFTLSTCTVPATCPLLVMIMYQAGFWENFLASRYDRDSPELPSPNLKPPEHAHDKSQSPCRAPSETPPSICAPAARPRPTARDVLAV